MSLPNPSAGDRILAAHQQSVKNHLEGAVGSTAPWHLRQSSGNFQITLSTNDGTTKFRLNDSDGTQVFAVDSDGNVTFVGAPTFASLVFPTSATPTQTTDGSVFWDTDDDVLTVGTGAATKRLGLTRGAGASATATARTGLRHDGGCVQGMGRQRECVCQSYLRGRLGLGRYFDHLDLGR
jgi:hypothetical protein